MERGGVGGDNGWSVANGIFVVTIISTLAGCIYIFGRDKSSARLMRAQNREFENFSDDKIAFS